MLEMSEQTVSLSEKDKEVTEVSERITGSVELHQTKAWLRMDADFMPGKDIAQFYYSLDGEQWNKIGGDYKMIFDYRRLFMGSKFALFCYATKKLGGYVDFDNFDYVRR